MLTLSLVFVILSISLLQIWRMSVSSSPVAAAAATTTASGYKHKSYPLIGSLISLYQNSDRLLDWFTHLLVASPSQTIVLNRLGFKNHMIITANPANVEHILKTKFDNYPKGKPLTDVLGDFLGMGIFNVDGELWHSQRKIASPHFTASSLREFVVTVVEEEINNRLLPLLENLAENDGVLDMQEVLNRLAFDTICTICLGWDPACLDYTRPFPPLATAFDEAAGACAVRGMAPLSWVWKAKRLFNVGRERRLKEAVRVVHGELNKVIWQQREEMDGSDSQRDLLSRLISAGYGDEMAKDMVISFLMAGRETTSAAMTWLFWLLTWHPTVEKNILDEVVTITNHLDCSKSLNFEDLKKLYYLKACLCESMRLYPPLAWNLKQALHDDVLPDGTRVLKGNRVIYFPYGMGRMEDLWGKNCLEFRPERWFTEPGVFKMESPYKFPVFHAGPRVCLGKEMAFLQMKYVVTSILRRFELIPICSTEPVFVPIMVAHMKDGLRVRVRKRGK